MTAYDRFDMGNVIERYVVNSKYREVLKLRYCEGLTHEQVAEATNYSTQHVKYICREYRDFLISRMN